jgi:hypothetical protein
MIGLIELFDTARDSTLQVTFTHTLVSTVTCSITVAWQRLSTADIPLPLGSRNISDLSCQILTATADND